MFILMQEIPNVCLAAFLSRAIMLLKVTKRERERGGGRETWEVYPKGKPSNKSFVVMNFPG